MRIQPSRTVVGFLVAETTTSHIGNFFSFFVHGHDKIPVLTVSFSVIEKVNTFVFLRVFRSQSGLCSQMVAVLLPTVPRFNKKTEKIAVLIRSVQKVVLKLRMGKNHSMRNWKKY